MARQHPDNAVTLSITGLVFDLRRFSIHDGPGIRTTVFLKGCPLRCAWCHNPEGLAPSREMMYWENRCAQCGTCIDTCQQGAISRSPDGDFVTDTEACVLCGECVEACPYNAREMVGREVAATEVMAEIEKDVVFYDQSGGGVTFSGGEPLMQIDFLAALLHACKQREISTAVDTTGFVAPKVLDTISTDVDLFLYDLKLLDSEKHRDCTGVSNNLILSNLCKLSSEGRSIIVRMPVIPGINDDDENIVRTGEFVSSLTPAPQVDILPYHNMAVDKYDRLMVAYRLRDVRSPSDDTMSRIAATLGSFGLRVTIGGQ